MPGLLIVLAMAGFVADFKQVDAFRKKTPVKGDVHGSQSQLSSRSTVAADGTDQGQTVESQLLERSASNQTSNDASNSILDRGLAAKGSKHTPSPSPPPVHYTPRTGHFVHLGSGKCQVSGRDPAFVYHDAQGPNCENSCLADSQCYGYSVSNHNNCIHWKECGLSAGGENWGSAHCNVKPAANICPTTSVSPDKREAQEVNEDETPDTRVAHDAAEDEKEIVCPPKNDLQSVKGGRCMDLKKPGEVDPRCCEKDESGPTHFVDPDSPEAGDLIDDLEKGADKLVKSDVMSTATCMSLSVGSFACKFIESDHTCQCRYAALQKCDYWFGHRNINLMIARSRSPEGILLMPQDKCSCSAGEGTMEYYCSFGFLDTVPAIGLAES